MELLDELQKKEAVLVAEVESLNVRAVRARTELAMVRHGISLLTGVKAPQGPRKWTAERLAQANAMHADGMTWSEVAEQMGLKLDTLHVALKRARRKAAKATGSEAA